MLVTVLYNSYPQVIYVFTMPLKLDMKLIILTRKTDQLDVSVHRYDENISGRPQSANIVRRESG